MKTRIKNLLLLLLLLGLPGVVQAQDAYSTNADGSIYTYSTNADGSANIVAYAGPPWVVTIPTNINGLTVTSIGNEAFYQDYSLTSVTLPGSVTSIGDSAFFDCSGLANVTISNGVTSIGNYAFEYCTSLTNVTIPNSVTSIGDGAFDNCSSLTSVTIPDSVTNIGGTAFSGSTNLTAITVDTNNPAYSSLNGVLFDKSQTTLIQYPEGLVGGSYTIPSSVTSIGEDAFFDCTSLTNVTIPTSVTSIGNYAFLVCTSLTSVTIPISVTNIGQSAFGSCTSLTAITVDTNNPAYSSLNGVLFNKSQTTLIQYPVGLISRSYTIPNSVTSIDERAFLDCTSLSNVIIDNGVTSIGLAAFWDCTSLTSVYFTGNAPSAKGIFLDDPATVYYLPGTTGWGGVFDGLPTAPWFLPNPQILTHSASFGVQPGGFGFTISWATNASVVVEAATNLANPVWIPVSTNNTLTSGTNYFSDPQWTNYPMRFYRAALAFTVGGTLTGLPAGDTVTLQDNGTDSLTLGTNGPFTFPTALPDGYAYCVTVGTSGNNTEATSLNGSGTISGANVTNVVVQCTPIITGNMDLDMYNAAVADGTANGGVPGVMLTEFGGPVRVTAVGPYSSDVCSTYYPWSKFTIIVGTTSCSSTILPKGLAIQFGTALVCGQNFGYGY